MPAISAFAPSSTLRRKRTTAASDAHRCSTRAVGDAALAVLDHRVLLGHAAHAGEADVLLHLAIDQVFVRAIADRDVVLVDLGDDAVAVLELRRSRRRSTAGPGSTHRCRSSSCRRRSAPRYSRNGSRRGRSTASCCATAVRTARCASSGIMPSARRAPPTTKPTSCSRMENSGSGSSRIQRSRFSSAGASSLALDGTPGRGHVQEGEMRGVERAFDRLRPVALLQLLRHEAVRRRQAAELQLRHFRHRPAPGLARPHVRPDDAAVFARRVGLQPDRLVIAASRAAHWAVRAACLRCRTSSRGTRSGSRSPRCGRSTGWRRGAGSANRPGRPRPLVLRKPTSASPSTVTRIGAPSFSGSSRDSAPAARSGGRTGPSACPGRCRVSISLSAALNIANSSLIANDAAARSRARRGAPMPYGLPQPSVSKRRAGRRVFAAYPAVPAQLFDSENR